MFCSKCGKTIHADDTRCPSCGSAIGDSRFGGLPYTSVQFTIAPGQKTFGQSSDLNDYTKVTYTTMRTANRDRGDADGRTSYRPVYNPDAVPEDVRAGLQENVLGSVQLDDLLDAQNADQKGAEPKDAPAEPEDVYAEESDPMHERLSNAAQESLNELFDQLQPEENEDLDQFKCQPIQAAKPKGISENVSAYIRQLEDEQTRKPRHRREAEEEYEASAEEQNLDSNFAAAQGEPDYDDYDDPDQRYEEDDYDDRAYRVIGAGQIIKIVVAVILVAALIVGGILVFNNVRKKSGGKSTIEGVTETLRTEGIALIRQHADSTYVSSLIDIYVGSGGLIEMSNKLNADAAAIAALAPAEADAGVYDATFISALQAIQTDITTAVTMDALAAENVTEDTVSESNARWQSVNNAIASLEACTTPAELNAIISGSRLELVQATPEPTPTAKVYAMLAKGDASNEVLELQKRLTELGYLNDACDGQFGSKTQTAVKAFQENAGLEATGRADNDTQTLLYSDNAPYAPGAATPAPTAEPTPEPTPEADLIQPAEAGVVGVEGDNAI